MFRCNLVFGLCKKILNFLDSFEIWAFAEIKMFILYSDFISKIIWKITYVLLKKLFTSSIVLKYLRELWKCLVVDSDLFIYILFLRCKCLVLQFHVNHRIVDEIHVRLRGALRKNPPNWIETHVRIPVRQDFINKLQNYVEEKKQTSFFCHPLRKSNYF